jgi:GNAT superfamily N-acetyltransferase
MDTTQARHAIEENLFEFFITIARSTNRPFYNDGEISWVNCAPSPWPNGIMSARIENEHIDEKIRLVVNQIKTGSAPRLWMTGPSMQPKNLEQNLERFGFVKRSEATGMAIDLSGLKTEREPPPELKIRMVNDEQTLQAWARIVTVGLFERLESDADYFARTISGLAKSGKVTLYVGFCADQAVASSTLFPTEGVAGKYHVATLPGFRNKGIGRSITLAPLLKAKTEGFHTAILQASPMGRSVYEGLGFNELSRLGRYWLDEK